MHIHRPIDIHYLLKNVFIWVILISVILFSASWAFRNDQIRDFGSFVASGRAMIDGQNPYEADSPLIFHVSFPSLGLEADAPNLNPPISIVFFELLADLDPQAALAYWRIISVFGYIVSIILLVRANPQRAKAYRIAWAIGLAGFWHTLELGQIYIPFVLACTGAWLLMRSERYISAGVLIGAIISFRPNFLFWPVMLLLIGHRVTAIASFISAGLLTVFPALRYGMEIYAQWLQASSKYQDLIVMPTNSSMLGMAWGLGVPSAGILVSILLVLMVSIWIWRTSPSHSNTSAIAIVVSLLVSPISWTGYTLMVLPIMFERKWGGIIRVSAAFLIVPVFLTLYWFQTLPYPIIFGWLYGWGLLFLLTSLLFEMGFFKFIRDALAWRNQV